MASKKKLKKRLERTEQHNANLSQSLSEGDNALAGIIELLIDKMGVDWVNATVENYLQHEIKRARDWEYIPTSYLQPLELKDS